MLQAINRIFGHGAKKLNVAARFEINNVPARGSSSVVHRAVEIKTGDVFALKLIEPKKTAAFRSRFGKLKFASEGEIQQKLNIPGVVTAHESGRTKDGQAYILLDYASGPLLENYFAGCVNKKIPSRTSLVQQLARTLLSIHQAGFIHRDMCPRNIFCSKDLRSCQLFDFGLSIPDDPEFNGPGNRTGCPLHMAPEIARRRPTDKRVDIFAFGVVAYQLLTGKHPWGSTEVNSKSALVHDTRPPQSILEHRPDLNPSLAKAIHKCLAPNPENRFSTMKHFLVQAGAVKREVA